MASTCACTLTNLVILCRLATLLIFFIVTSNILVIIHYGQGSYTWPPGPDSWIMQYEPQVAIVLVR